MNGIVLAAAICVTTLDGLPMCPPGPFDSMPSELAAGACLQLTKPHESGGYCEWYGYATKEQADAFEKAYGYERVVHEDGSGDTWKLKET